MLRLLKPLQSVNYNIRSFYSSDEPDEYMLRNLWDISELKLDPNCLPYKNIKTSLGEILIRQTQFKTKHYFLKFLGKHFVFIYQNQRRVIPICSHLQ